MVCDGFSFEGKWDSCSRAALGRVTDHRSHLGWDGWLLLISGVVVVGSEQTITVIMVTASSGCGWLGRGRSLLITVSLCPGTFSEVSDFDMAVKAPPMEDCQVPLARRAGRLIPLSR